MHGKKHQFTNKDKRQLADYLEEEKADHNTKKIICILANIKALPVNSNGKSDYKFMENYIKSLPYGDRL